MTPEIESTNPSAPRKPRRRRKKPQALREGATLTAMEAEGTDIAHEAAGQPATPAADAGAQLPDRQNADATGERSQAPKRKRRKGTQAAGQGQPGQGGQQGQSGQAAPNPQGKPNVQGKPATQGKPNIQGKPGTQAAGQGQPAQPNQKGQAQAQAGQRKKKQGQPGQNAPVSQPGQGQPAQPARKGQAQAQAFEPQARGSKEPTLRVIPLGGMREIGKNMTALEYGQDMIIVDCGIAFPDEDMPGVDVVIPDFAYVRENIAKLRGVFLTHGHEDHIGALPWLCKEIQAPVYGNHLTLALVRQKLEDRGTGVKGVKLIEVSDGDRQKAGVFDVEFIHTNHSIADANALAIRTPAGIVFHSGDFKIDYTPINGTPIDLKRIAEIGAEGVLLFICESTNIERPGHTSSESKVGETLINLFDDAAGRIFVTTFSSNVFRIQQIITAAEHYNRKVALIGRSMLNYFSAADTLGYLKYKPDTLVELRDVDRYAANEIVFITTGSQGEPMSALTRMAFAEHRQVEILPGDTVILSSSAIPGNEKPIYRVINELYKRGARVIYESLSEIHVSGHAYQEELKIMHTLLRPRYFVPAHGEYRHLFRHAELANSLGQRKDHIFLLDNGDVFEYSPQKDTAMISGFVQTAGVLIDGSGIGDIDEMVLRDRLLLADDGVVAVSVAIGRENGELVGEPIIQARGFIYEIENRRILKEMAKKVEDLVRKGGNNGSAVRRMLESDAACEQLQRVLYGKTQRRPMILMSVLEV